MSEKYKKKAKRGLQLQREALRRAASAPAAQSQQITVTPSRMILIYTGYWLNIEFFGVFTNKMMASSSSLSKEATNLY